LIINTTSIISALGISFILHYFFHKIYLKKNIIDKVNIRSSHSSSATRSGGVSVFIAIFLISFFHYANGNTIYDFSILVPLSLLAVVGLYDDVYNIDFKLKFIFQIIAAKIIVDSGLIIDNLHGVFYLFEINRLLANLLTIFIIVAIINAINFIDGIDGLAISIMLIFVCLFELFSKTTTPFINFSILLSISTILLLYFNFRKEKKVFLGDSGSHLFGGIISIYTIYILSQDYVIKESYDLHKILFVFSILSYPIIDIVRVVFLRIYNGKSPFEADRNHIHHFILRKTKSHLITTISIIIFTVIILILLQAGNLL
jgi:UDP-GlcNAc:undecaprenyl-phosphate GlcNAc-1-phosphate transferase